MGCPAFPTPNPCKKKGFCTGTCQVALSHTCSPLVSSSSQGQRQNQGSGHIGEQCAGYAPVPCTPCSMVLGHSPGHRSRTWGVSRTRAATCQGPEAHGQGGAGAKLGLPEGTQRPLLYPPLCYSISLFCFPHHQRPLSAIPGSTPSSGRPVAGWWLARVLTLKQKTWQCLAFCPAGQPRVYLFEHFLLILG